MTSAASHIDPNAEGPRKWSEPKVILSLVAIFWVGIQVAHFLYDVLQGGMEIAVGGTLFFSWLADLTHPGELAALSTGAILSFAIYLALKPVKRKALRAQILMAGAATLLGTACFSLACIQISR